MTRIEKVATLNQEIQELEINLDNFSLYYPLPEKMKELFKLVNVFSVDNPKFNAYIKQYCIDDLSEYIIETAAGVPERVDRKRYMEEKIDIFKWTCNSVSRFFKKGCDYYGISIT